MRVLFKSGRDDLVLYDVEVITLEIDGVYLDSGSFHPYVCRGIAKDKARADIEKGFKTGRIDWSDYVFDVYREAED